MSNGGTYNVSYSTLPTFTSSDVGFIVPGSQTTMQTAAINIPVFAIYTLGQFTNVASGIYLFNLTGNFSSTYSTSTTFLTVSTYLTTESPSSSLPTTSIIINTTLLGPTTTNQYQNGINMSSIVQVNSPTTYYIICLGSLANYTFQDYTFSLCKIA
jgi:hypothetical protein